MLRFLLCAVVVCGLVSRGVSQGGCGTCMGLSDGGGTGGGGGLAVVSFMRILDAGGNCMQETEPPHACNPALPCSFFWVLQVTWTAPFLHNGGRFCGSAQPGGYPAQDGVCVEWPPDPGSGGNQWTVTADGGELNCGWNANMVFQIAGFGAPPPQFTVAYVSSTCASCPF